MYTYTCDIAYTGSNAFVQFLWPRLTRNTGIMRIKFDSTAAEVVTLRAAAVAAGFAISGISRVPVAAPEVVA